MSFQPGIACCQDVNQCHFSSQTCQYFDTHNFKIPTDYLKVFIWYTRPAKSWKKFYHHTRLVNMKIYSTERYVTTAIFPPVTHFTLGHSFTVLAKLKCLHCRWHFWCFLWWSRSVKIHRNHHGRRQNYDYIYFMTLAWWKLDPNTKG